MQNSYFQKIQALQEEIEALKFTSINNASKAKVSSLMGYLKGVKFSESEIKEAQRNLFSFKKSE